MKKIRVMSVFGTRPEAIKMAPLVNMLKEYPNIESIVCVTAQHRQMLDQVLEIFNIVPDYDLDIMKPGQTLTSITVSVLEGMERILSEDKPDLMLVHGDTTTSTTAALAAFYNKISVGHVEAGLRSHNKFSPYPEEMNRMITARIADLHFSPTQLNAQNLKDEGINKNVYVTGNTVIDALHQMVKENYRFCSSELLNIDLSSGRNILLTAHRRENLGEPLRQIFNAIRMIVEKYTDIKVIYPVHLNPSIRNVANEIFEGHPRIFLIEPVDVQDMHNLMKRCYMVMTDSGGLQEEAPALGKPVLVLRTETERPEAVQAGTVKIVGIETLDIFNAAGLLLDDSMAYERMAHAVNPYGDGNASKRICEAIVKHFSQ